MNKQIFNDLATVSIYHFCDVAYKKKAIAAARRLTRQGIIDGLDDARKAYEKYEELVIEHATEHLPKEYTLQYDYWGAKCFSDNTGWRATKTGLYAGDSSDGRLMLFQDYAALEEYTDEQMAKL